MDEAVCTYLLKQGRRLPRDVKEPLEDVHDGSTISQASSLLVPTPKPVSLPLFRLLASVVCYRVPSVQTKLWRRCSLQRRK